ncbi:MAG: hypothetical protein QF714_10910 [Dehalococcoidia bacterium]|jgi:hypothetical protein|nr:hypothetical protein [Dehalococcoidia bacterium]MDP6228193.1 hypothetical protein [Dehalococcoidia bacterium]MDP7083316.1 hypothetical protein [Dehalococcoidia bacterium]MDP7200380.1 hypothetical protein [Dehalococcoidia bacterium]MDP7509603.1 hypothetical protein [Dehalococcoidia bacterium]|tara:strand:- start:167 stop:463 length:297 start_codon:yes stop_codon:yes gene_type:complete
MPEGTEHILVNPTTEAIIAPFDGAPRLPTLAGTRLGVIDDSKRNADVLLEELVDLLRTRYEISDVKWHRKPSASKPADPEVIRELAESCDSVIVAVGD